jgi:hypothetical protein
MFLTDTQTYSALADTLKAAGLQIPDWWRSINQSSHAWAYNEIVSRLLARGFTQAQIAAWDRGAEFEQDLTIYRAMARGAMTEENVTAEFIGMFDRREELTGNPSKDLKPVLVANAGVWQTPADTPGTVGVGAVGTAGFVFNFPDPQDPGTGNSLVW